MQSSREHGQSPQTPIQKEEGNMKTQITCTWNPESPEETKITFSEGYRQESNIAKADFLKDVISDLQDEYDEILKDGLHK